jgi:hypothetical protein
MGKRDRCLWRVVVVGSLGCGERCLDVAARRQRPRLGQAEPLLEPSRNRPTRSCPGHELRGCFGVAFGQAITRRYQAGERPDPLVRAQP